MTKENIKNVVKYWNENPIHSVEFRQIGDLKSYIENIDSIRWTDNERWARRKFYEFGDGTGRRLLDAGCGIGVFTRFYSRYGFDVHAIDLTPTAVEITKKSLKAESLKAEVNIGNVEDTSYPDNYFDYIVSNGVIHHTTNTEGAVKEFYRILKPGGIASVCVYYKNILLRQPLWSLVKLILPIVLKKKYGREKMLLAKTPEEFVCVSDGNDTPIAKVYSREQADKLFECFKIKAVETHYFPIRFLRLFSVGGLVHKY